MDKPRSNPLQFIMRITEFLAGPPLHEELTSLREHIDDLQSHVTKLEAERDAVLRQLSIVAAERENLKRQTEGLRNERDKLKEYRETMERERNELKQREELAINVPKLERLHHASKIPPGTFVMLNQKGDNSGYWNRVDGLNFGIALKAVYDPVADQVLFSDASEDSTGTNSNQLLRYDVAINKWSIEPASNGWGTGASYDTNALNPDARELYVSAKIRSNSLRRLNLDSRIWSSMTQPETVGFVPSEPSAEYFPDRDELLWLQGKRLAAWKRRANSWHTISPLLAGLGSRSAIARYNPVSRCVIILGGANTESSPATFSHGVYKYDADGLISRLNDSPESVKIYFNRAVAAVDPTTGDLILIQATLGRDILDFEGGVEFWKYSVEADTWTRLNESIIPPPIGWWAERYPAGVVATPISKYGVIMYMSFAGAKSSVFVYRHMAANGNVQ